MNFSHFKRALTFAIIFISSATVTAGFIARSENSYSIYVDKEGRMRRSDNRQEVRFFGTNYTLPFAHACRAMDYLGIDHKTAVDRDVYHLSRMGINAFRLHLWDVEISDSIGNLQQNNHLDLLDYLLFRLEQRNISIILTAQTNFGNGYPERNTDTGAYSYNYDKCLIHEDPDAIKAQQRYIGQLASHLNPYTGRSYADDRSIIAMEINNEPCHQSNPEQVKAYVNSMARSLRKNGWHKPVLYNVSHNMDMVQGYFSADIQGTTYQWYPIGLVAGHERKGNFLPYVDSYDIPFSNVKGFGNKARIIYEFDPADMLQSYMFPAVARTFAENGFQWATQFAYDPIDMARFNTEYQTHYLNLAYTPQKALGMRIAAKAMEKTPYDKKSQHLKYPADTVFGDITVSYRRNLSFLNSPEEYIHTNNVDIAPVSTDCLRSIAGYGTSPVVTYDGRGAYMLDRIDKGLWRLELFPDVLYAADPFSHPSLSRETAYIINAVHPMTIKLPDLGRDYYYRGLTDTATPEGKSYEATVSLHPEVYLLSADSSRLHSADPDTRLGNIRLNEYVAPPVTAVPLHVRHIPAGFTPAGEPLVITAEAFGDNQPDSLVIYPAEASFWKAENRLYTMHRTSPYTYQAVVPADDIAGKDTFAYRIVAVTPHGQATFPDGIDGTPLDWDAPESDTYSTRLLKAADALPLVNAAEGTDRLELSTIPEQWNRSHMTAERNMPFGSDAIRATVNPGTDSVSTVLTAYVADLIRPFANHTDHDELVLMTGDVRGIPSARIAVVNTDGITYSADLSLLPEKAHHVRLSDLQLSPTLLCPAPYPVFLSREFIPDGYSRPLSMSEIEKIQIVLPTNQTDATTHIDITGIWLQ